MKTRKLLALAAVAVAIVVLGAGMALALDSPAVTWWVIGGGGGRSTGGNVTIVDTLGQPAIGTAQGGAVSLSSGYWYQGLTPASLFSMTLTNGWNLISSPMAPANTLVTETLRSITGSYDLVYAYVAGDPSPWKIYDSSAPDIFNDLKAITEAMGLWIRVTSPATVTLALTGTQPASPSISLVAGWNLVGYPSPVTRPITESLASCDTKFDLIYTYVAGDPSPWKIYDPAAPPIFNDITDLAPGRGYWIRMTQACVWNVP
jgi:hypothetical protein